MNTKARISQIKRRLDPKPLIECESDREIHIWWRAMYGVLIEEEDNFNFKARFKHACSEGRKYLRFDDRTFGYKAQRMTDKSMLDSLLLTFERRAKELDDPMHGATRSLGRLGQFEWNSDFEYWEGETSLAFWDGPLHATIEPDQDDLAADAGFDTLRLIAQYQGDLRERIGAAVFQMYNEFYAEKVGYFDDDGTERALPKLAQPAEIWPLIVPPYTLHLSTEWGGNEFTIGAECRWDEEHGVGVRIQDWAVVAVGENACV